MPGHSKEDVAGIKKPGMVVHVCVTSRLHEMHLYCGSKRNTMHGGKLGYPQPPQFFSAKVSIFLISEISMLLESSFPVCSPCRGQIHHRKVDWDAIPGHLGPPLDRRSDKGDRGAHPPSEPHDWCFSLSFCCCDKHHGPKQHTSTSVHSVYMGSEASF